MATSKSGLVGIPVHINWGQSEDFYRGYDDYPDVDAPAEADVPAEEPWAGAYRRGWEAGFATAREHAQGEEPLYGE